MEDRKKDHINLALANRTGIIEKDERFVYEPLLSGHSVDRIPGVELAGKTMKVPVWISSMTGGSGVARHINTNLARAANEFGLGMGLGSCRILLESEKHLPDFDMRKVIGDELPFWANLGIAQLEQMVEKNTLNEVTDMVNLLRCDGLVIHVNPLQEWFQPEGDRLKHAPLEVIKEVVSQLKMPVLVKEVGQGMGRESLRELMKLPLAAIEFAAFGGTNFARVEMMRRPSIDHELFEPMVYVGQTAQDMLEDIKSLMEEGTENNTPMLIISGGIRNYLDGYYFIKTSPLPAAYGMASGFLKHARDSYSSLRDWAKSHIDGLIMAHAYLRVKNHR
ncbi:MAG: type 2 isopentenyl-diphosphate Delta-isomerase [Bacteroidetes bacterium]|nr:MAG: type 2 isopentenyl-diphosphate Delta-isomerase [Bacteroidota bacterium]